MMYKYTTRLMYPEPEATGGGETQNAEETPVNNTGEESQAEVSFEDMMFSEQVNDPQSDEQESEYDLGDIESLGLEPDEADILRAAGKSSGATPKQAISLVTSIRDSMQKRAAQREAEAKANLEKEWGEDYTRRIKEVGQFIQRVGAASGWSAEMQRALATPQMARVFDAVNRYVNSGRPAVVNKSLVSSNVMPNKQELKEEAVKYVRAYFSARARRDTKAMQENSDKHLEIQKKLYGNKAYRHLLVD